MRIHVKTGFGTTLTLEVEASDSIISLKKKIQDVTRRNPTYTTQPHCSKKFIIIPAYQHLFHNGKRLDDAHQLRDYSIQHGDTLNLFLRFRPFGHTEEHHDIEMQLRELFGSSVAYEACCNQKFWTGDKLAALRCRFSQGFDVNRVIEVKEEYRPCNHPRQWSLLMASVHLLDLMLAKELLEAGARVDFKTPEGKTVKDVVRYFYVTGAYCRRSKIFSEGLKPVADMLDYYQRKQKLPPTAPVHFFTAVDLKKATGDFDPGRLIGSGSYGSVYRGVLNNKPVAVRLLNMDKLQDNQEFRRQIKVWGSIRHPHIVRLYGFCEERMSLVYELMEGGNLENKLAVGGFPWHIRLRIAHEAALGLFYLHNSAHPILHREFKPSNILLDARMTAKVADMGLALQMDASAYVDTLTNGVKGTFHYIAPEYMNTGVCTEKCDVYSFGVMLLQLITNGRSNLVRDDVREAMDGDHPFDVFDKREGTGLWPGDIVIPLAKLGLRCAHGRDERRPGMAEVVQVLRELQGKAMEHLASRNQVEEDELMRSLLCPITTEIFKDPVVTDDGHTYERKAIQEWLDLGHRTSPLTNLPISNRLVPNHILKVLIAGLGKARS